jgi:2-dehydropantoate 2-reductase
MAAPVVNWGDGAIGGSVRAWLKRAGHDVTFVDVVGDHVTAIENPAHLLRISGLVEKFTITAPAWLPAGGSGIIPDHVLQLAKRSAAR